MLYIWHITLWHIVPPRCTVQYSTIKYSTVLNSTVQLHAVTNLQWKKIEPVQMKNCNTNQNLQPTYKSINGTVLIRICISLCISAAAIEHVPTFCTTSVVYHRVLHFNRIFENFSRNFNVTTNLSLSILFESSLSTFI